MLSRVILSVAFLAAAVAPVVSVPVAGAQMNATQPANVTQPTVQPANQTVTDQTIDGLIGEFLE